jgi:hypothetical protein
MRRIEHHLDKYIFTIMENLKAIPEDNTQVYDTSQLQMMCLEKFANFQGYQIQQGLFVIDNPASRVMTLDNMVALYNNTMAAMGESLKGQGFIKKVWLAGRNLRRNVTVRQHKVALL